ncbi:ribonuclease H-like protein [Aulographum hederae CBS 113979]|uniref:Ribonuclease H n=1 Tax=Aulographum hederae CBS 113979 TaxID=1176131 RepID=A0A6G1GMI8_9PEZI|nr:ribonuclease H-like protein [Aulographum hederae CBS 113979]
MASNGAEELRSTASTSASSGTKRKREAGPKFYAVRVGFTPGIYHSWADCLSQVKGYKAATFKSFTSLTEAEAFLKAPTFESTSSTSASTASTLKPAKATSTPTKFYAVQNGRVPGVYTDWPSAQQQITGWTKPKHKSFTTRSEAEAFVAAGASDGHAISSVHIESDPPLYGSAPPSKKRKKSAHESVDPEEISFNLEDYEPGTAPLPADAEDGFDDRVILDPDTGNIVYKTKDQLAAKKLGPTGMLKNTGDVVNIHTDGSSLGNGKSGAVAGVGVFFGPGDTRNLSETLPGARQTNQRAELTAIVRALDLARLDHHVCIHSDSNYAIQCVTVWFIKWRENGWQTAGKKPVENKDLVEKIVERVDERRRVGAKTEFVWVKGHANDPGNNAADGLAVQGAIRGKKMMSERGEIPEDY